MSQSNSALNGELVFKVIQEPDGGYVAQCLTEGIVTQGDTWEELKNMVKDAVEAYFFDAPKPRSIRLHLVRDEVLSLG
jgi:predicted RNase H-like HicB family nuclease